MKSRLEGLPSANRIDRMGSPFLLRRDDFEIPREEIFLDGAYMSPLPAAARKAVQEAYDLKAFPARIPYKRFFEFSDSIRTLLAQVLGLPEEEIGITNSTGYGAMQIAQGLPPCRSSARCRTSTGTFRLSIRRWLPFPQVDHLPPIPPTPSPLSA